MDRRTVEAGLMQKLNTLENAVACVASAKASLRVEVDSIRKEISDSISQHLSLIRAREQELLRRLDSIVARKENCLSEQQQQLHTGIGSCQQALECLRKDNGVPSYAAGILTRLSHMEVVPKDVGKIEFEKDSVALRCALANFGTVRSSETQKGVQSGESLPLEMEDYDDDMGMSHKSVMRLQHNIRSPATSDNVQQWLSRIPSSALDTDLSALMAEFEIVKQNNPADVEQSETSSFDVLPIDKYAPDQSNILSPQFIKMLNRPLSEWLMKTLPPLVNKGLKDDSSGQATRNTKRRHSMDNPIKAKKYEFETVISNIGMSSADGWRVESNDNNEASESETLPRTVHSASLPNKQSFNLGEPFNEEEFLGRLNNLFTGNHPSTSTATTSEDDSMPQHSVLYWKQVLEKIQKSSTWLMDSK